MQRRTHAVTRGLSGTDKNGTNDILGDRFSKRPRRASLPSFVVACLVFVGLLMYGILCLPNDSSHRSSIRYPDNQKGMESQSVLGLTDQARLSKPVDPNKGVEYHMVFSTGCTTFQDWQSYVFFYHAMKVGQPGHVTRIASGCTPDEAETLTKLHKERIEIMSDRFHLHLTPDFMGIKKGFRYKFFNKPFGMRHWMENALGYPDNHEHDDSIVILLDPDQILLRPITNDFSNTTVVWKGTTLKSKPKLKVEHGSPFAQMYGFGSQWKMKVDMTHILPGETSPVDKVTWPEARDYYPAGPPYLATARDMYRIVDKWTEFVPKVHDDYPFLLAEMFAYSLAAAHVQLPHQLALSFMISDVTSGEGWSLIDPVPRENICKPLPRETLPFVLHYCQRYMLGKWFIGKHRLEKDFISCESPLLMEPPDDIALKYNYAIAPGSKERIPLNSKKNKRNAFMLCTMIPGLNEAAEYFKKHNCEGNANFEKTFIFHPSILDEK